MKQLNTPDSSDRDQDWNAGADIYLGEGVAYWKNETGKTVRVVVTCQIAGLTAHNLANNGQTVALIPCVNVAAAYSATYDVFDESYYFTQDNSLVGWRKGYLQLFGRNPVIVPNNFYLIVRAYSSDAADNSVRLAANKTKIWDVDDVDVGKWLGVDVTLGGPSSNKPDVNVDSIADAVVPTLPTNFEDLDITATTGRVNIGKITDDEAAAANLKSSMDSH